MEIFQFAQKYILNKFENINKYSSTPPKEY